MPVNANRILHADADSFFASCEIALDHALEGRPVWVGGGRRGDGIVIAANRLAKKFGVKMPKEVPMTTTERAYTSPIWYTPGK